MSENTVIVAGQELVCRESAGTGRPVVLVHGNSSSSRTWHALMDGAFGAQFRCLALDLPGHGRSKPAADTDLYSMPGYAGIVAGFMAATSAEDAVVVGWSLGGHIALEAAPQLPDAAGFVIFGTPPVGSPAQLAEAFLPNPAMNVGFTAEVDADAARSYAASFLAPGSTFPLTDFVADILATDGAARAGLMASIGAGRFTDEVQIAAELSQPLAVLHGEGEQLVSLDYLRKLTMPTMWRGGVRILPGAGHAPQEEAPEKFAAVLTEFVTELP
ncbi:pimeloyl-ACP methyl ester carboxylesterase [Kibdelosporangium banguiense]|uniref:Pimeloyl-ACP methyl ester carboxylesterase n=1 Tax=Kibdelosporangium banguiense TaxID=1365924 RepID=A0ABS4TS04_9PSEU|nr:alpha/beta hydrolase [Kibdelosporangium banguiense]MBP2327183.1 pimeloyl-ACP methyl ester carboxylesterase [Kibdelosporangium banguiense]